MTFTLAWLAERVRQVMPCTVVGDASTPVERVEHPAAPSLGGALAPCFDADAIAQAVAGGASALLVDGRADLPPGVAALTAERPRTALGLLLTAFDGVAPPDGVDPTARIAPDARVDPTASVGAFAVVGTGASIGARSRIAPHVVIERGASMGADCRLGPASVLGWGCSLGDGVILQAHATVGADGFSYDTAAPSNVDVARGLAAEAVLQPWVRIPSRGTVELGDGVEIGAGACIDRPTLGVSRIGAGTKIDNLVQIAHHVEIGEHCLLAAQTGVAGSCVIEDGAVLGGQAGIVDHQRVGRLAVVLGGADVHSDIPPGEVVAGAPARPRREWFKRLAAAGRLERVRRRLRSIEDRIASLEEDA